MSGPFFVDSARSLSQRTLAQSDRAVGGSPDPTTGPTVGLLQARETFGQRSGGVRRPAPNAKPRPTRNRAQRGTAPNAEPRRAREPPDAVNKPGKRCLIAVNNRY